MGMDALQVFIDWIRKNETGEEFLKMLKEIHMKKYDQMIDRAYEVYSSAYEKDNSIGITMLVKMVEGKSLYRKPGREMFEGMVIHDGSFAKRWGFKVLKREMTWEEKVQWVMKHTDVELENLYIVEEAQKPTTPRNIIEIEYENEKTYLYE